MEGKEKTGHKGWFVGLFLLNASVLLCLYFFSAMQTENVGTVIYQHTMSEQSDKFYIDLTPSGFTFGIIWALIYVWQAVWVIYSLVLLCRKTAQGPAYLSPVILPPMLFAGFMGGNICSIAWTFLYDRDIIDGAFVAILGIPVFLIMGLVFSYRTLDAACPTLVAQERSKEIWVVRILVHNGISTYATWTAIATLLGLDIVISYRSDPVISTETAGTVALAVLAAELLVFYPVDLLLLDRYTRYTLTPYCVIVWALGGSIAKNWADGARNSIFTAVLMAFGCVFLVVKIVMLVYRHFKRERYPKYMVENMKI